MSDTSTTPTTPTNDVVSTVRAKKVTKVKKVKQPENEKTERKKKVEEACGICCELYTSQVRKKIICPYCQAHACSNCQKMYITSSPHSAHCMSCKVAWNDDFLQSSFTKSWLHDSYSIIESNQLWELEKSMLPETSLILEKQHIIDGYFDNVYMNVKNQIRTIQRVLEDISSFNTVSLSFGRQHHRHLDFEIINLLNSVEQWNQMDLKLDGGISSLDQERIRTLFLPSSRDDKDKEKKQRAQFVKACPKDGCRGFLSTAWKCNLCDTRVCSKCHVIKATNKTVNDEEKKSNEAEHGEHVCNPDDVASAQLIAKDSKNCPKCGVSIFRISGCDQMFCTNCSTAFHWKSLAIINKGIHNPHYFEWLNRNNAQGDGDQGGENEEKRPPTINQRYINGEENCNNQMRPYNNLHNVLVAKVHNKLRSLIQSFIRSVNHINDDMNRANNIGRANQSNEDIRLKYLRNEITTEQAKSLVYARTKRQKFVRNVNAVIDMLYAAATSIVNSIPISAYDERWNDKKFSSGIEKTLLTQMTQLMTYYNECILKLHQRQNSYAHFELFNVDMGSVYRVNTKEYAQRQRREEQDKK